MYEKTFTNFEQSSEKSGWWDIDGKVSQLNFFRFQFRNFNIYYATLIIITFLVSIGMGIDHFILSPNNTPLPQNEETVLYHSVEVDTSFIEKSDIDTLNELQEPTNKQTRPIPQKKTDTTSIKLKTPLDNNKVDEVVEETEKEVEKDSLKTGIKNMQQEERNTQTQEKQTVVIKKQDVIIRDTVYQYKKRKVKFGK